MLKLYIAILKEFPDYMVPTLVGHAVLGAHLEFSRGYIANEDKDYNPYSDYLIWLEKSFKKCVVSVNQKEFDKILKLDKIYLAHENNTLDGKKSCIVVCPREEVPNVLKFAKLWKPKEVWQSGNASVC